MSHFNDNDLGNKPAIVVIGLVASCISIFVFLTGWQSIWDIVSRKSTEETFSPPAPTVSYQSKSIDTSQTPVVTSTATATDSSLSTRWVQLGLVGEPINDIDDSNGRLYVATDGVQHGIFRSDDMGKNWQAANNGLQNLDIIQIGVSEANPNQVYALSNGVWRSDDGGNTWLPSYVVDYSNERSFALASSNGLVLYWRWDTAGDLLVSRDGGKNWQGISFPWEKCYGGTMRIAPSDRTVLYTFSLKDTMAWACRHRVSESKVDWYRIANVGAYLDVYDLSVSYYNSSVLFVATPNGVYKSMDAGGSWTPVNNGLPYQGHELLCTDVETSPWGESEVFAVCGSQVYESHDLGATWDLMEGVENATVIHPMKSAKVLLVATEKDGLFLFDISEGN